MPEPILVEGRIKIPYRWPAGKVAGRFLEEKRLLGLRCSKCGKVICPPRPRCLWCKVPCEEWVPVGPEGTVTTWTRTKNGIFALIQPDGADTAILKRLDKEVKTGMRVTL